MEKPTRIALAPATISEILDRTFRIYRDNFASFVGLVAAVTIPISVVSLVSSLWFTNALEKAGIDINELSRPGASSRFSGGDMAAFNNLIGPLVGFYVILLLVLLVSAFVEGVLVYGPLTYIASESNLGRKVTIGQAFRAAQGRFGTLATGLLVYYLLVFLISVLVGLSVFVLFLCGLTPGMAFFVGITLYAFLTPVLVLERVGALEGIGRAWALAKARFWPMFGFYMLVTIVTVVLTFVLGLLSGLITRNIVGPASLTASTVLQIVFQAIINIVIQPILPIGLTLMYYDARIRLEGLDIALQNTGTDEPRPADLPSPPPPGETFGRDDFINMGIVAVGGIVVGVLYLVFAGGLSALMLR